MQAHGFRVSFTPRQGCFPPFPHGTCALSVSGLYSAFRDGPRQFGRDSSCPALLRCRLGRRQGFRVRGSHPPRRTPAVWASPPSLAATDGIIIIFFSCGYLDVSVPRVRLHLQCMARRRRAGLPHSDIRGSQGICPSPRLFAACHVLLRHPEPRHPPCALLSLSSCPAGDPLAGVHGGRSVLFSASSMSMCFW